MGGHGGSGKDDIEETTAKHLLDSIGKIVHKKVHEAAQKYTSALHGDLSQARFQHGKSWEHANENVCELMHTHDTNVRWGESYPCKKRSEKRFSDEGGGECDNRKIRGSKNNSEGACAPYRRLNLCDYNLEKITDTHTTSTHNLLLEVCLAAQYEGASISDDHAQYRVNNPDFKTNICTELARSFADIGDIIRGKDLYRGNKKKNERETEREKLEKSLKNIFAKIYGGLTNDKKSHYESDKPNYFKLREDWWEANREIVWKAITCKAPNDSRYFRTTCSDTKGPSQASHQCRCTMSKGENTDQVPTYFDYVPQFLRWFEEWAEDFCRKRKHKLENAIKICRGTDSSGKKLYCDLNGYDCKRTVSAKKELFPDSDCKKCSLPCNHFRTWIDNQQKEFDKQRNKYSEEIKKQHGATITNGNTTINNLYVKDFYDELKTNYRNVEDFLKKLNKEGICESQPEATGEKADEADFTKGKTAKTFDHTKYCQACPWCGMECNKDGTCKKREDSKCHHVIPEKEYPNRNTTTIPVLTPDKSQKNILQKYNKFCNAKGANGAAGTENGDSQINNWQCHYDDSNKNSEDNDNCILGEWKHFTQGKEFKSYNVFFYNSIIDMLKESIDWRERLKNCINNKTGKCIKSCKKNCECYKKWVKGKKEEWDKIKDHFRKQGDIENPTDRDTTLKMLLNYTLLNDIKEAYPYKQQVEKITKILENKMDDNYNAERTKTSIDKFLDEEEAEAEKCINCQDPPQNRGRALQPRDPDDDSPQQQDTRKNPCSGESGGDSKRYPVVAHKVAYDMHESAKEQLDSNGTRDALRGNIENAEFKNGGNGSDLAGGNICSINGQYSNADPTKSNDPCSGKGDGFVIGKDWTKVEPGEGIFKDAYMPPRRQHFCTSNLEHLHKDKGGKFEQVSKDKATHSLLGDVLLAAKYQADWIITKYKEKNRESSLTEPKHQATICRAMKYSFADIGDIIKGTDLWDKDTGEKKTQDNLVKIFGQINRSLKDELNGKYEKDDDNNKYINLRKDWWEANRDQVWNAMKCSLKDDKITKCNGIPIEDYIPQRLRWMTEWAEWFCKAQSQEYEKLETDCDKCMVKGKGGGKDCYNGTAHCGTCKKACEAYQKEIEKWKPQWNKMQMHYGILYSQAKTGYTGISFGGDVPDYQQVVDFFKELKQKYDKTAKSSGVTTGDTAATQNTPYKTAEGYVHQEAPIGCNIQTQFCENENAVNSTSDRKENKKYAFKKTPPDYKLACDCKDRQASSPRDVGRSDSFDDPPSPRAGASEDEEEEDEEQYDEEEEEEDEEDNSNHEDPEEVAEETVAKVDNKLDVCGIVAEAFSGKLDEACTQKYGGINPRLGWKCIPTTNTTNTSEPTRVRAKRSTDPPSGSTPGSSGSICVPPRRRRLYLHKLPDGDITDTKTLSEWFVKSAAVETFFLWHRYKQLNTKGKGETQDNGGLPPGSLLLQQDATAVSGFNLESQKEKTPQELLQTGEIPEEFKRQMFYTIADYRDILFGKNMEVGDKEMAEKEQKIKEAIEKILPKNSVTSTSSHSGENPQTWWSRNAPSIWEAMVCALIYKENGDKKIVKEDKAYDELLAKIKEENGDYHYKKVTLSASDTGSKSTDDPTLEQFTSRPPYFRYLQEWGETFCSERQKRLEEVKKGCMEEDGGPKLKQKCSGYGEDCKTIRNHNYDTISSFNCPDCGKPCSSYRKWIGKKKTEYEKQKKAYNQQKDDAITKFANRSDNEFAKYLSNGYASIKLFLEKLGSCKINNENNNAEGKNIFEDEGETFGYAKHCDPCPIFGVKCNNGHCWDGSQNGCQNKTITADVIENMNNRNGNIDILVRDDSTNGFEDDLDECYLSDCADANIFEGFRREQWKCGKVCDVHICGLKKKDGNIDEKQIILIRALLKRWVQYFLEDYIKIKHKISHCTKNKENKCFKGCEDKCKCVDEWIKQKKTEWEEIKKRYVDQYKNSEPDDAFKVKTFLEDLDPQTELDKAMKPCGTLKNFESFCGLNSTENSKSGKERKNSDIIDCMLENLGEKAQKCPGKPSEGKTEAQCQNTHQDDEEEYENEEENPVKAPNICPKDKKVEVKEEDDCKTEDTTVSKEEEKDKGDKENAGGPPLPESTAGTDDQTKKGPDQADTEKKVEPKQTAPKPPPPKQGGRRRTQRRVKPPPTVFDNPLLIPAMTSSTLAWSVGIGFVALSYWWLLKKKTKSSVDMLRVLEIPKSDYDIPTLKSSNKYIPYASSKYRGKRYIYIEGDTDEDKYMFMSDTSDITSSSESEYEELDINDIYAPGSPKYKTLIEVVFEPSGKTQNDIPSDNTPMNKFNDKEWNTLKHDFISNALQNEQNDVPNDYTSGNSPTNTNNTTMSRDKLDQKPFIMSIHDRNLYTGEEYSYDMTTNSGENDLYSGQYNLYSGNNDLYSGQNNLYSDVHSTSDNRGPTSGTKDPTSNNRDSYSGIDLINDSLNSDNQPIDIYDEILKRKENELFGTNHVKQTSTHTVAKPARDDPIHNQLNLFHKWLDRHRNMCEKWDKNNKVDILKQLKEEWNKDYNQHNGENTINKMLNTDVSIQIDMDNPKPTNEFTNMDTNPNNSLMDNILDDLDKTYNEPYYEIYEDDKPSVHHNNKDLPTEIHIEIDINNQKVVKEKYPIADMWDI
ncbi:erythrocyte membrane protein 1, PfEMP1 [Plasmodium reichenowi]|uniref:Erythrocyte membrane protein 1, PfEMP1 n=1 Tax=Plasmodium reichenowi TaxID=5854 RepID=A0A2P9DIN0_PLARE|nr:erythrocyte membrane protein 1, PfEMP1 [Plasmodium reichenowi]